jgi:predicted  nucleic acid-binding Zn-ribbon protein
MKDSQIRNMIRLYIEGKSYSEISKKVGMARSTVQSYVEKWRSGELDEYRDAIPYEEEVLEIARYLRSNGISIQNLREPLLNHQVLMSLNMDLSELIKTHEFLKPLGPSMIPDLVKTVAAMKERGIDYSDLSSDTDSLINEKRSLENEIIGLKKEKESGEEEISKIEDLKIRVQNELNDMNKKREAEEKALQIMEETIQKERERIEMSDTISGLASNLGIDLMSLEGFMRGARRLGYDAKAVQSMKMLQDLALDIGIGPHEINQFYNSLKVIRAHGWNDASISELANIVSGVGETPKDALDLIRSYVTGKNAIIERNSELLESQRKLERSVEDLKKRSHDEEEGISRRRSDELGKLSREKDSILSEINALEEKRDRMTRELSEAAGHIVSISRLGEIEKRVNAEVQSRIDRGEDLEKEKQKLENQISQMAELVKFASGIRTLLTSNYIEDNDAATVLRNLCSHNDHADLTYEQRKTLRSNMVDLFLKLFDGELEPVVGWKTNFIKKADYDFFMRYREKLGNLHDEIRRLEDLKKSYGSDMKSMIQDALSGSKIMDAESGRLVLSFAENVIEKKISSVFNLFGIMDSEAGNPNNALFLMGVSENGTVQAGQVDAADFVRSIRDGRKRITMMSREGEKVTVDVCSALKQIFSYRAGETYMEKIRFLYREGKGSPDRKLEHDEEKEGKKYRGYKLQNGK